MDESTEYSSESSDDKHEPIEKLPWHDPQLMRGYLCKISPEKKTKIMSSSPSEVMTIALQDYDAKTLKSLLSFFKAKYSDVQLGSIEEHGTKNKQQLIKEMISAIGKVKVYYQEKK